MRKQYLVFINPMHGVQLGADELEIVQSVLVFKRDGVVCAQFTQYLGWLEAEEKREPASVLSLVPGSPAAPTNPDTAA